jgi:hypothetical protein
VWLWLDRTTVTWDEACRLTDSVSYSRWLWGSEPKDQGPVTEKILYYPPFVGLLTQLVFPFVGFNADAAILFSQSLFALILMFSLYGLTNLFCREREAGIIAGFLVLLYPVIFTAARHFLLDLPLTAMSTLAMWLLLRAHRYGARRDFLLLGLALGLGMLTKGSFAFYLALPTLVVLLTTLRAKASRRVIVHASLAILVALVVAVPWYGHKFFSGWDRVQYIYTWGAHQDDPLWTKPSGLLFYLLDLIPYELSLVGFLFFLLGAIFFLRAGLDLEKGLVLAWIIAPMIILTPLRYKDPRYAMPYLPAMALITVAGLYELKNKSMRNVATMAFIVLLVVQYYALSFGLLPGHRSGKLSLVLPEPIEFFSFAPQKEDWKTEEVLEELTEAFKQFPTKNKVVFVVSLHQIYNADVFNYLSYTRNLGIRFIGADDVADPVQVAADQTTSYILLREFPPYFFYDVNRERVAQAMEMLRAQPSKYVPIHSMYLPDGSMVILYGKP